jgi:hypothetical protein
MPMMYAPPSIDVTKSPDFSEVIGTDNILIGHNTGGRKMRDSNILIGDRIEVEGSFHFAILINNQVYQTVMTPEEQATVQQVMLRALGNG